MTTKKPLHRAASVRSQSFDEKEMTVELVWTTGAAVQRYDWRSGDEYLEVLSLEPGAVRLDRLNAGAPLLNTHASWTLEDVIGSVVRGSACIEGGKGIATVKLSGAAADADTIQKIRDGVIRNISVGYVIHACEESEVDGVKTRTATDWEPLEISAVPIPADAGAQFRSHGRRRTAKATTPRAAKRKVPTRIADIRRWAHKAGLRELGEEHVRLGTSSDDFFLMIADHLMGRTAPTPEEIAMSKDQREFETGRRWAERTLGRKSSRDDDDPKKDDDLDEDERDGDEVCATCGKALDDHDDDRDDDIDDDRDEDEKDKDDEKESDRAYLRSARRGGQSVRVVSGSHPRSPTPRAGAKTPKQPWSDTITKEGLDSGRRHWERATGRKAGC